jgi:hypothetical protein
METIAPLIAGAILTITALVGAIVEIAAKIESRSQTRD